MKLVINTQYCENYGDADKPYWKFKGGEIYIVEGLNPNQVERILSHGIPTLKAMIEYDNPMSREYIINHEILDDDVVVHDSWESPVYLSWENNTSVGRTKVGNDDDMFPKPVVAKVTKYTLAMKGEKTDTELSYIVESGEVVSYKDIMSYIEQYEKA